MGSRESTGKSGLRLEEEWGADRDQSRPSKAHDEQLRKGLGTGFCTGKKRPIALHRSREQRWEFSRPCQIMRLTVTFADTVAGASLIVTRDSLRGITDSEKTRAYRLHQPVGHPTALAVPAMSQGTLSGPPGIVVGGRIEEEARSGSRRRWAHAFVSFRLEVPSSGDVTVGPGDRAALPCVPSGCGVDARGRA